MRAIASISPEKLHEGVSWSYGESKYTTCNLLIFQNVVCEMYDINSSSNNLEDVPQKQWTFGVLHVLLLTRFLRYPQYRIDYL
jgi:hypothetical protein